MNTFNERELIDEFREAFSENSYYLKSNYISLSSKLSDVSSLALFMNSFLKRYETILSIDEKKTMKKRIDRSISKLLMLDQRHILCLHYFLKNLEKNPFGTIKRTQHFMVSMRTIFEIAPDEIPLESTVWNYFVRDISNFAYQLKARIERENYGIKEPLTWLLLNTIQCLISISNACERNEEGKSKIRELYQKSERSLQQSLGCLQTIFGNGGLESSINTSPGLCILLNRILIENFERFSEINLSDLKQFSINKLQNLRFDLINDRTKNFYILNALETGNTPPKNIIPDSSDAFGFLAMSFIRFENGASFFGVLPFKEGTSERIDLEEIDSFSSSKEITTSEVQDFFPLHMLEKDIKQGFAEIIGEQFVQKDWGGEYADLFSNRVILNGRRVATAFMFKGRGLMTRLTLANCGQNGDQVIRLFRLPGSLFVIQHIHEIDTTVLELAEIMADVKARQTGRKIYYCLIDGLDTARLLKAYNKLTDAN